MEVKVFHYVENPFQLEIRSLNHTFVTCETAAEEKVPFVSSPS